LKHKRDFAGQIRTTIAIELWTGLYQYSLKAYEDKMEQAKIIKQAILRRGYSNLMKGRFWPIAAISNAEIHAR